MPPELKESAESQPKSESVLGKLTPELELLAKEELAVWMEVHGIKNEAGRLMDWREHLYLFDILSDLTPKQVCLKAAQVGWSTLAIMKSLWLAKNKRMDIIYTLPSQSDVIDFVSGKVNRIVHQNPVLQNYVKEKDSVEQKSVGESVIYYRGTWTEQAALMITSDLNIYDEEDRSKASVIDQYASRLQHSKYKWEWHFSNPSALGHGVSRYWELSDKKEWFIICKPCGEEQFLRWPENIDLEKKIYVCSKCKRELSSEDRRTGRWKPTAKGEWSGYHINLMMTSWTTAAQIIDYSTSKSAEYFANFVLGLPYVTQGNVVTEDTIARNLTLQVNSRERVIIGCDSGLKKHFVVGNREGIFHYGVTEDWKEIESLLKFYPRSIAVIDSLPDLTAPRDLKERYLGRVFLNHYSKDRRSLGLVRWGSGKEYGNVITERNRTIQMIIDEFNDKRIPIQGTLGDWRNYIKHWLTLYKLEKTDALGTPTFSWESSNGMDHWVHATVYWRVGMERFGGGDAKVLEPENNLSWNAPKIKVDPFGKQEFIYEDTKSFDWRNA
jgi:hypothetical protein